MLPLEDWLEKLTQLLCAKSRMLWKLHLTIWLDLLFGVDWNWDFWKDDDNNDKKHTSEFTFEDIRQHRFIHDGWVAIHGKVYDLTSFIKRHPGGRVIQTALGRDGTALFETHHNLVNDISMIHKIMEKIIEIIVL